MAKANVLYSAILAAICAFSSQANSINNTINSGHTSVKKNNVKQFTISANDKLLLIKNAHDSRNALNYLCNQVDVDSKKLMNKPESLTDKDYDTLLSFGEAFFAIDKIYESLINDEHFDLITSDIKDEILSLHKTYRIAYSKLSNFLSLAKQIKVVPDYFESNINFSGLKDLTEHSNRIFASIT